MARPTALTDDAIDRITSALRAGVPLKYACEASGICYTTALRWLRLGRGAVEDGWNPRPATRKKYVDFVQAVEQAEAEAVARHTINVAEAGKTTWKASAWLLEHRWPDDYRREVSVKLRSTDSLESELIELLGPEKGGQLIADARLRVSAALNDAPVAEPAQPAELPPAAKSTEGNA